MGLNNHFSQKQYLFFTVIIAFFLFFCWACKYDPLKESTNGLLKSDTLEVGIDTLPVELFTIAGDPVNAFHIGISPLGSINDPLFGKLKADFISNIIWEQATSFSDKVDSVTILDLTLQLSYDTITYGDEKDINFKVYEVIKDIPDSSKSNFKPDDLYDVTNPIDSGVPEKINDSTAIYSVKLKYEYASKFIDQALINDSSYYYYDTFRIHLKGLYIKILDPKGKGGLIKVSHTTSTLTLRTLERNINNGIDTISNIFYLANPNYKKAVHINMYTSIPSPEVNSVLNDSLRIHSMAYIQALSGPKILVKFPTLGNLRNELGGKIIVNKAELILPVNKEKQDTIYKFNVPPYLGVFDVLTNNIINDDGLITGYIGGAYNTTKHEYRINIGNHIHSYFQDITGTKSSNELYLFAADFMYTTNTSGVPITIYSVQTPGRVVLNNKNTTNPPLLKIIYTKIPK